MTPPPDKEPIAAAMEWVSRITTVGIEMVLPGMIGYWVDRRLGTSFLALIGFGLGMVLGFWHLLRMTQAANGNSRDHKRGSSGSDSDKDRNFR